MSPRFLAWFFLVVAVGTFAAGTISIMRLRVEADMIGSRILRLERDTMGAKKEHDLALRRLNDAKDTVQLQGRVGDVFRPPLPEQVVWVRGPSPRITPPATSASPRIIARELASYYSGGQAGPGAR